MIHIMEPVIDAGFAFSGNHNVNIIWGMDLQHH
jgi:hypothetical protein